MASHICPAPGCGHEVPSHLLMCYAHWRRVPNAQQQQVNRRWRAYLESPPQLRSDRWTAYMVARKAAIDSVNTTPNPAPSGAPT